MNTTIALPSFLRPSENLPLPTTSALDFFLRFGRFTPDPASSAAFRARCLWRGSLRRLLADRLGLPPETPCIPAAPVSQQMGMNQAHLASGRLLGISADEAAQWCAGLSAFFADQGWQFHPCFSDLWLLTLPQVPAWRDVPSVLEADGQADAMERIERLAPLDWLAAQTEIQMWLHAHPLNARRPVPVNGVWLWNDSVGSAAYGLIAADNSWALGKNTAAAPRDWAQWENLLSKQPQPVSDGLIFLEGAEEAADYESYCRLLQTWEKDFFAPARAALQSGRLNSLTLTADGAHGGSLTVAAKARRAFWKRKKTFDGRLG